LRTAGTELNLSIGADISGDIGLIKQALLNGREQDEKLRSSVEEHEVLLAKASEGKGSLEWQVKQLQVTSKGVASEIEEGKRRLAKIDRDSSEAAQSMEQLNLSPQALEGRRLELVDSQSNVQKELDDLQIALSTERAGLKSLEEEIEPLQLQEDRLKKLKEELLRLESEFAHGATAIGLAIDFGDDFRFEEIQRDVATEQSRLSEVQSMLHDLIETVNLAKRRMQSDTHRARILALAGEIATLQKKCETLTQSRNIADLAADRVRQAGERRTERVLRSCTSLVENYYNRMYPHPLWSKLELSVDADPSRGGRAQLAMFARRNHIVRQELSVTDSAELNVKYSFSTGQLNLFALSLVLALAHLRKGEVFNTILLDDPVQAMDDMRVAELCWILLQLSRSRQVVVATGNQNFVDLLFHRAAPLRRELSIVSHLFTTMTSKGPDIWLNWRTSAAEDQGVRVA
jgi:DNA repair exonuclease SbcCD ATPase subunit